MTKQQARVIVRMREMILQGELAPGQKIVESVLATTLGVSRTPIRQALPALAEEGLITETDSRGFEVRAFGSTEILDAIDIRANLEGLSARLIAEHGATRGLCRSLHACLQDGDHIFSKRHLVVSDAARYSEMNGLFHSVIVEGSGSKLVAETIRRINRIPFVAPRAVAFDNKDLQRMFDVLFFAHRQHHAIVQAIENGESARVEALMREHVNMQKMSLNLEHDSPVSEKVQREDGSITINSENNSAINV